MASTASIYYNKINIAYPRAGKDNDSQGFRDNFRNIFNAFSATNADIESLKLNAVTLGGTNDFGYNTIKKASLQSCVTKIVDYSPNPSSGNIYVNFEESNYQKYSLAAGSSTFYIQNWPTSGYAQIIISVIPATTGTTSINFGGNITVTGFFNLPLVTNSQNPQTFELWTDNGGVDIYIKTLDTGGNDLSVFDGPVKFNSTVTVSTGTYISFEDNSIFIGDVTAPFGGILDTKIAFGRVNTGQIGNYYGIYSETDNIFIINTSTIYIGTVGTSTLSIRNGVVFPSGNNAMYLGTSTNKWLEVWSSNGTVQTSDQRSKDNIQDSILGLEFIKDLRPVSFNLKDSPGSTHWGLIAQEVKTVTDRYGISFAGWVEGADEDRTQHLIYTEFIAPLIQSVKELAEENKSLRQELDTIKHHLGI